MHSIEPARTAEAGTGGARNAPAGRRRTLPTIALALQRSAGNRATRLMLARFQKGMTKTTVAEVRVLPFKQQIEFLIAVSKREQVPETEGEVRDLHRGLVFNSMGRAANRAPPYAPESEFGRDVGVLEKLSAKLETATLDEADVTSLIRAMQTMEREPEAVTAAPAPVPTPPPPAVKAEPEVVTAALAPVPTPPPPAVKGEPEVVTAALAPVPTPPPPAVKAEPEVVTAALAPVPTPPPPAVKAEPEAVTAALAPVPTPPPPAVKAEPEAVTAAPAPVPTPPPPAVKAEPEVVTAAPAPVPTPPPPAVKAEPEVVTAALAPVPTPPPPAVKAEPEVVTAALAPVPTPPPPAVKAEPEAVTAAPAPVPTPPPPAVKAEPEAVIAAPAPSPPPPAVKTEPETVAPAPAPLPSPTPAPALTPAVKAAPPTVAPAPAPTLKPTPAPAPTPTPAPKLAPPKKEPEKPKGPRRLDASMAPSNVEDAIRHYTEGGTDDTGASPKRVWDTWSKYVSSWDKPKSAGGKSNAWGFSSSHVLKGLAPQKTNLKGSAPAEAGKQKWILHVHRTAAGAFNAATVQWADLEGAGGEKSELTAKQLARIGVPEKVDPYADTGGGGNKVPGVWKYNWPDAPKKH